MFGFKLISKKEYCGLISECKNLRSQLKLVQARMFESDRIGDKINDELQTKYNKQIADLKAQLECYQHLLNDNAYFGP